MDLSRNILLGLVLEHLPVSLLKCTNSLTVISYFLGVLTTLIFFFIIIINIETMLYEMRINDPQKRAKHLVISKRDMSYGA